MSMMRLYSCVRNMEIFAARPPDSQDADVFLQLYICFQVIAIKHQRAGAWGGGGGGGLIISEIEKKMRIER